MTFKKLIVSAAAAVTLAAGFAGTAAARGSLNVGTEPTFAPFEFLDTKTHTFTGFDMDLIRAVADKAGYDVKIMNMGFDALIPALETGTIDVIASGISITPERAKRIDFTTPYYKSGLSYLIRKDSAKTIKSFDDLKGKKIAVQIGNTGAEYAKSIPGTDVKAFNTTSEAFMDLNAGNSDAVILDRPVLAYFLKSKPKVAKNLQLSKDMADSENFGFAVKKGNTELLNKLNAAYGELKASGEVDKIYKKWFAD
ncbi:MAG: Basic amino acid ABC transporter substrate-binding protein [Burkholderia sp.]|jgi:polar amino acid transport system substrate-binding protein